mgnify:CR=1 FL=1
MIRLLSHIFWKRAETDSEKRRGYGLICSALGVFLNIVLFAVKFAVGKISGSLSVTADAFNNLSDSGSSVISILGFKLAAKKPDPGHPFGHGRMEYISALAVSALILIMGFELAKTSVQKIIHPEGLNFSIVYIIILGASILVKLWMAYFNNKLYKHTDNINLKAVRQDSQF